MPFRKRNEGATRYVYSRRPITSACTTCRRPRPTRPWNLSHQSEPTDSTGWFWFHAAEIVRRPSVSMTISGGFSISPRLYWPQFISFAGISSGVPGQQQNIGRRRNMSWCHRMSGGITLGSEGDRKMQVFGYLVKNHFTWVRKLSITLHVHEMDHDSPRGPWSITPSFR
jgi:hypothetical protein